MITTPSRAVRPAVLRMTGLAVAVGVGLSACTPAGSASDAGSDQAEELSGTLNEHLAAAGLPALDMATATTLYGTDGGVSCTNVGELQQELGLAQFGSGSGKPRRIVLDPSIVAYDLAVIETYCRDKIGAFQDMTDELQTAETIP